MGDIQGIDLVDVLVARQVPPQSADGRINEVAAGVKRIFVAGFYLSPVAIAINGTSRSFAGDDCVG